MRGVTASWTPLWMKPKPTTQHNHGKRSSKHRHGCCCSKLAAPFWTLKMGCDVVFWDVATSSTTQALALCALLQTHDHTCSMVHTICHTGSKNMRKSHVKVLNVRLEVGCNGDCSMTHHQPGVGWHDLAHNMSKASVTSITHLSRFNLPFNVQSAHTTHGMPSWGAC